MPIIIALEGLYVGEHELRIGGGRAYVHIPRKAVGGFTSRKVKVTARVNASRCEDRSAHGSLLIFPATLVEMGGTYRLNLPSYYYSLASKIAGCGSLEIWLAPRG
jgi:hypothetical protein